MKHWLRALLPLALGITVAGCSSESRSTFPGTTPITIVVPFAAGGPTDRVARDLAEAMRKPLNGATIVIENAAGAGGSIGAAKVARAKNDGHTLLLHHIGMASMPALVRNLSFNVENDFEYLGLINDVPMTLIGRPTLPASNYQELLAWIRQNSGKVNLGNAGPGSASHLCGILFQQAVGVEMTTVPYKGTGPAMTDLLAGQIDLMCDQTTNTTGHIESGKVKAYASTLPQRLTTPALKDLPTMQEVGHQGFSVSIFHGLYAPKGTPEPVLRTLNEALKAALKDPEFLNKQQGLGAVVVQDQRVEPAQHKAFVQSEIRKWTPVLQAAGVYVE